MSACKARSTRKMIRMNPKAAPTRRRGEFAPLSVVMAFFFSKTVTWLARELK